MKYQIVDLDHIDWEYAIPQPGQIQNLIDVYGKVRFWRMRFRNRVYVMAFQWPGGEFQENEDVIGYYPRVDLYGIDHDKWIKEIPWKKVPKSVMNAFDFMRMQELL